MSKEKEGIEKAYDALRILGKIKYELGELAHAFKVTGNYSHAQVLQGMLADVHEARAKVNAATVLFVAE